MEFLQLFRKTIVDCSQERHAAVRQEKNHYQRELAKFERRRKELLEMRINGEIAKDEYKDLKDIVDNQIARLTFADNKTQLGDFDLESAVSGSVNLITNLASLWKEMLPLQKQRLQKVVLPRGIAYRKSDGVFGTAILSPVFRLNREFRNDSSGLVAGVRQSWNQIVQDIQELNEIVSGS
jgi:hypothetical protein